MKTIKEEKKIEFIEKKSKFIGHIKSVSTKEEAETFIAYIKNKYFDATHNCSAYKITTDTENYFKFDDDGEPSGTAGKPMGDIISYMKVTNIVIVATRYFGGIKLGAGGLIRAYARTAKDAINACEIVDYIKRENIFLDISYEFLNDFEIFLKDIEAEIIEKNFLDRIFFKLSINVNDFDKLKKLNYVNILYFF